MRLIKLRKPRTLGAILVLATFSFATYKHFFWQTSARHAFQRSSASLADTLRHNSHPNALFYKSMDSSPFALELQKIDLRKPDLEFVEHFLSLPRIQQAFNKFAINVAISDIMPVNRAVPDSRPQGCKSIKYPEDLPTTSVVIPFHNEWPSILLRTVHSIIDRTPAKLLKQIILVDDASDDETLKSHFDDQLDRHFGKNGKVTILRLPGRVGLIRARLEGFKQVTGDVVSFFDSHMEVNENWLPPLLAEVKKDRHTVAMAQLDYINRGTLEYQFESGYRTRYGFDWNLVFFETYFRTDQLEGKDETDPLPGVVMVGPGFVVDVNFFKELGTYDNQMKIWGGENIEFPWRVWMCGGRLIHVPCSRIGHIARPQPYLFPDGRTETELYNYKRAVEVWMGDYKSYVYDFHPEMKDIEVGDLTERLAIKDKLQCKSFDWFLKNIWPDILPYRNNVTAWGWLRNGDDVCVDNEDYLFSVEKKLGTESCSDVIGRQTFALTSSSELKTILQCVVVKGTFLSDKHPTLLGCFEGPKETWEHKKGGQLRHVDSGLCMDRLNTGSPFMTKCDKKAAGQKWTFQHYL